MSKHIKKAVAAYTQDDVTRMIKKRVFIYIRVSTREQAEEGYSIGEQEERLKKYCDAMDWEVVRVFIDGGYTGANIERPAMQEMIEEIEKGNADIVLVDKLDRLSRSQFDTLFLIQKVFTANNTAFVSRAEAFDTSTPFGRAMVGILAVFAELERERIKERMADGKEGRAKEGKYRGGAFYPTGYDYDADTGFLVINEYDAMQVREVFKLFNERTPIYTIMTMLNDKGFKTKNGAWNETRIRGMVENQTYIGKLKHSGKWYEGGHDPIIDEETFAKAQAILAERSAENEHKKEGRRYKAPLGGLPWCLHCGARYHYRQGGRNKDGTARGYYICYSRDSSNRDMCKDPNCKNKNYRDKVIEKLVFDEVLKLKSQPDYIDNIHKSVDESKKAEGIIARIEATKKQISNLMDLYSLGSINLTDIKDKIDPLNEERNRLEATLQQIKTNTHKRDKKEVLHLVELFEKALAEDDSYMINTLLNELITKIMIDDADVIIYWNF